jgi:hypothetical protein
MGRKTMLLLLGLASARASFGQPLVCPAGSPVSGKACETFHFHVQMYSPEAKGFAEVYGINQFASQSACEQAREARTRQNLAVVEYMKRSGKNQQYEADRIGPCHCDKTIEKSSSNFLTDVQRALQLRMAEEIRMRVRERLMDSELTSDSELVAGLKLTQGANPLLGGPRLAPLPAPIAATSSNAPGDLRPTRAVQSTEPVTSGFELPLAEIPIAGLPPISAAPPARAPSASAAAPESAPPSASQPPSPAVAAPAAASGSSAAQPPSAPPATAEPAPPAPSPSGSTVVATTSPEPPVAAVPSAAAPPAEEDAADAFISYETQRIQSVLKASSEMADDSMKSKILEACMRRIQLLSNLRLLIQGSGARSRIAVAARNAREENDRLSLVTRLFGSDMPSHWAPKQPADVVLDPRPDVESDPEKVLRDSSGESPDPQKKRALCLFLGRAAVTEEQQLWLIPIIDRFLQ